MGQRKNDHFRTMMDEAKDLLPRSIVFDSWYSSWENLKLIHVTTSGFNLRLNAIATSILIVQESSFERSERLHRQETVVHLKGLWHGPKSSR